jgi:inhibitor of KinA
VSQIEPLGDQAVLVTCRDEETAQRLALAIRRSPWEGVQDVVVAYHTLAIYLDLNKASISQIMREVKSISPSKEKIQSRLHCIPCCYEMGPDLSATAEKLKLAAERIIELHTATTFTVYAIGFSPGFPYLGWLPKELQGLARRAEPRLQVPAGSVGIVGKQSAIYPEAKPGGWPLIGRTPLELVNVKDEYFPIQVGDQVRFESIDEATFRQLQGKRL